MRVLVLICCACLCHCCCAQAFNETNVTAVENPCIASASTAAYSTGARIGGVFILLGTSLAGVLSTFSLGAGRGERFKIALQYAKFFGIGVMVSTAWIHLLPDSYEQFGSPCLTGVWLSYSKGWVGVFGMLSTFFVQMIDYLLSTKGRSAHNHGSDIELSSHNPSSPTASLDMVSTRNPENLECDCNASPSGENLNSPVSGIIVDPNDPSLAACAVHGPPEVSTSLGQSLSGRDPELSVLILEAGILVHSFIIGLTMGVSDDTIFDVLLIAVAFHQAFEGMGLGAILATIEMENTRKKLIMAFTYPFVTPIGIAIGIAVHTTFNANDPTTIVVQGALDSLSAGILFYNTYTELFNHEISMSHSFRDLSAMHQRISFGFLYVGAIAMAVLGIWS